MGAVAYEKKSLELHIFTLYIKMYLFFILNIVLFLNILRVTHCLLV
jgi:hypothetical protein